jgi:isocitrate dehydrogenase
MLSIVPLMAGGGMYETGAGGSAPKHVQQLVEENHLRWDSLGEFLALAVAGRPGHQDRQRKAKILAKTLDAATGKLLDNNKSRRPRPAARQPRQPVLPGHVLGAGAGRADRGRRTGRQFAPLAKALADNEQIIVAELAAVQGKPVDIGGYYKPDFAKLDAVMRPSPTLNAALATVKA